MVVVFVLFNQQMLKTVFFQSLRTNQKSLVKGFSNLFGSSTSKPYLNRTDTPSKLAKYGGMPTRIATYAYWYD